MTQVTEPFPIFYDDDGTPLENGMIYIGQANQDPRTNPITVYTDDALTAPIAQPITTIGGRPAYQGAPVNLYVAQANYSVDVQNRFGTPITSAQNATAPATAADLAAFEATLAGLGGAALIGEAGGGTVQDAIDGFDAVEASLLDLTNALSITSATALAISDLNRLVIAGGSTSYTVNLPSASVAGSALKLEIARTATGVVTIQAAAGSGKLVNGNSLLDMIAGESALFVYDGTNWRTLDWTRVPILAEMVNTAAAAQSLTTGAFTDVSMGTAGVQLMATDLSTLWNVSGGYFTAPREMICRVDLHMWLAHSTGPGQYDVGVYAAATGGGSPDSRYFSRISVGTETFRALDFSAVINVPKGQEIYPAIQPQSPLTAAEVVAGSTVVSRVTVTELFRA